MPLGGYRGAIVTDYTYTMVMLYKDYYTLVFSNYLFDV